MRKTIRIVFFGLGICGIFLTAFKHAEAAWTADPLATLLVGSSLLYVIVGLLEQALE